MAGNQKGQLPIKAGTISITDSGGFIGGGGGGSGRGRVLKTNTS